jgi:hypothetical protein
VDEGDETRSEAAPELGLSEEVFTESETDASQDVAPEEVDQSIEADSVAPEEQGPGDSEGAYPEAPEEERE